MKVFGFNGRILTQRCQAAEKILAPGADYKCLGYASGN